LRQGAVSPRDLFRRPLDPLEVERYDAVVFDPPRAGAEKQALVLSAFSWWGRIADIPVIAG
jgi:23S rRNA (uracil1939-C5)-methyltransferase